MSTQATPDRGAFGWFLRIIFFLAIFFAVFVTVGLSGYHLYLAITNQTTYEMIKPQIVDSYIKDEMKRKRKFQRKQNKLKMKQLKQDKMREMEREKELKNKQNELQKKIDDLQHDMNIKDDEKYNNEDESDDSTESSTDSTSDDLSSLSEKVLLFHDKKQKQKQKAQLKRKPTPKPNQLQKLTGNKDYENTYINYFDEGICGNIYMFISGTVYPEFKTPLPCTVIPVSSSD